MHSEDTNKRTGFVCLDHYEVRRARVCRSHFESSRAGRKSQRIVPPGGGVIAVVISSRLNMPQAAERGTHSDDVANGSWCSGRGGRKKCVEHAVHKAAVAPTGYGGTGSGKLAA